LSANNSHTHRTFTKRARHTLSNSVYPSTTRRSSKTATSTPSDGWRAPLRRHEERRPHLETYPTGRREKAGSGHRALVKHEDRFFIANETGDLIIGKLSPKGYEEISRWHMLDPTSKAFGRTVTWSHPAFAQQSAFARNDKELIRVSLAK